MFSKPSTAKIDFFSQLLQHIDHPVCVINSSYKIEKCNLAFDQTFPPTSILNRSLFSNKLLHESLSQVWEGQTVQYISELENQIFELKLSPLHNAGETFGLIQFFPKSTQTFDSEQALQYKYIVDHIHEVLFQTDALGNWVFLNQAWSDIFEYTLEESLGRPFYEFLHPEDVRKNELLFAPLINQQKSYCKHIIRYISKSHKIKWIEVFATLVIGRNGEVLGTSGTLRDITNEKENARINTILSHNVQDIVCIHDLEGKYLYVSPSISLLTGYCPEELLGQSHYDFFHPDDKVKIVSIPNSSADSEVRYISYRFRKKNNEYVWIETSVKIFFDDYDICDRMITSSRSIQEHKLVEESMMKSLQREKELNQLKSRFVNMTSHEFRTPLATIRSSAEIIEAYIKLEKLTYNEKITKQLDNIQSEIHRISNLISETLLIGKIESQQLTVHREEVNVIELINFAINRQNQQQKDHRITELEVVGEVPKIWLDPQHFIHILDNLISNAFKYSLGKRNPIISVSSEKNQLEIQIKDFGIGIPLTEQGKMYSSFFRAKNVGIIEGTGLGLVIVKNLVQLNNGHIYFVSSENQGTTFFLDFTIDQIY